MRSSINAPSSADWLHRATSGSWLAISRSPIRMARRSGSVSFGSSLMISDALTAPSIIWSRRFVSRQKFGTLPARRALPSGLYALRAGSELGEAYPSRLSVIGDQSSERVAVDFSPRSRRRRGKEGVRANNRQSHEMNTRMLLAIGYWFSESRTAGQRTTGGQDSGNCEADLLYRYGYRRYRRRP